MIRFCNNCIIKVDLPCTESQWKDFKTFGKGSYQVLGFTPDQIDFMETGLCPDCDYVNAEIEVTETTMPTLTVKA